MGWPWQFVELDRSAKQARRESLNHFALVAHLSALAPLLIALLLQFAFKARARFAARSAPSYAQIPGADRVTASGKDAADLVALSRQVVWWLGGDVVFLGARYGQRGPIVFGLLWTLWLLFLCVQGTGNDYFHVTKRFGAIAVSQLPLQYLMSAKKLDLVGYAFGSSHEQVNQWHRALGRVTYFLLTLHALFYLNYYVQKGVLGEKLASLVPLLGLVAFLAFSLLASTAVSIVRQYSYRVFFFTHLIAAVAIFPLVFFHAPHEFFYFAEALVIFVVDMVMRRLDTVVAEAKMEASPGADLIKIVAAIPPQKMHKFLDSPGAHVYVNLMAASRSLRATPSPVSDLQLGLLFNPFTICAVDEGSKEVTLVARIRDGPVSQSLRQLCHASAGSTPFPLSITGPYGCSTRFPALDGPEWSRTLLVSGGVGATFTAPLYRAIRNDNPGARVTMVWAVRNAGEATWVFPGTSNSMVDDDNVQIFLTGDICATSDSWPGAEGVEMDVIPTNHSQTGRGKTTSLGKRPDLSKVVDDTFRQSPQEQPVAILVCGPWEMGREMRQAVSPWVQKGRKVLWHNESFGW